MADGRSDRRQVFWEDGHGLSGLTLGWGGVWILNAGQLQWLADENRALADLLKSKGIDVTFQSSWDGHHWHNWRDQLRDALTWVFARETQ